MREKYQFKYLIPDKKKRGTIHVFFIKVELIDYITYFV